MTWRSLTLVGLALAATSCRGTRLQPAEPRTEEPTPRAPVIATRPTAGPVPGTVRAGQPAPAAARRPAMVVWDERVSPVVDCNPVKTQHTVAVTVLDTCGCPMPGQRVEWILARHEKAVGDIVAVDDQYTDAPIAPLGSAHPSNGGNKIDNQYAVSVTNWADETIDAANNYPFMDQNGARMPDIRVGKGQTWITVTSLYEGVTDIIAYVPGIKDGSRHKIYAKKVWADYAVRFPDDATNLLPNATHAFTVNVRRASDGAGISATTVDAEVLDGPEAAFEGGSRLASASTGADGNVTFTLRNTGGLPGVNRVRFTAKGRFQDLECPRTAIARKTWQKVALECRCALSTTQVTMGDPVEAVFTVTNTGDAPSGDVTVSAAPPPGLVPADGTVFPLSVGNVGAGQTVQKAVRFTAAAEGPQQLTWSASSTQGGGTTQCECSVEVVRGRLELTCRCEPASVDVGSPIQFVGTVKNAGQGVIRNLQIRFDWPEGVTPQTQNTVALPELRAGGVEEFVFQGTPTRPGRIPGTLRVAADGFAEQTSTCDCGATQCALDMELIAPGRIGYAEPGNFTVKVTNRGDGNAQQCVVRVTHGSCLDGGVKDFNLGSIAPGQTATWDWVASGTQNAKCVVAAEVVCQGCTVRKEVEVEVTGLPALQSEMIDQNLARQEAGVFVVGDDFLYVLTVQNDVGTQATPPLKVVFSLPPELSFVSATSDRGVVVTGAGQGATSDEFRLDLNEKVVFEFRVKVTSVPPGNWVKVVASIQRASDGAELANESESTTVKPPR
jgi:uncharacterized repeat protein (TIGR01451 family)